MSGSARLGLSLGGSLLIHALAVALVLRLPAAVPELPQATVIPVSLWGGKPGGGGSGAAQGPPAAAQPVPEPAAAPPRVPSPRPARPQPRAMARSVAPTPAAPPTSGGATASGPGPAGAGRGGDGRGVGEGEGAGGGGAEARVAYGTNPLPPYPLVARRLGMEGVVLLEVVVAPDGRASDVHVARSSGHPPLDESAVRTVRATWRFIPGTRDGRPVESRVTVPIRFHLTDEPES